MGDLDPQQTVCVFCLPKRDRRTGDVYRNCDRCVGRGSDRWCECTFCPWLDDGSLGVV